MAKKKKVNVMFSTRDIKVKNKLDAEGFHATQCCKPEPFLFVMNVKADKVCKEECPECGNLVCICPPKKK